jgi:carboxyl-terminal processing protease
MNIRNSIIISALLGILSLGSFFTFPDNSDKERVILDGVIKFLEAVHYSPEEINDEFSKKVYQDYISDLDPGKRFLTREDIAPLNVYELQIDDIIRTKDLTFFDQSAELIVSAIDRAEKIYAEVAAADFDFEKDETLLLNTDEKPFAKDAEELKEYWRKSIKYDILTRYYRELEDNNNLKDESKKKTDAELMAKVREKSNKTYTDWFKRLHLERRSDRFEIFINSIVNYFDPHTDYFSPKAKEDFDINMGGKLIGIGARLTPKDEYTQVATIIPGGPAHRGKELEADDLILKVKQDGEEPLDVIGMRLDDVVTKIRGEEGTKVTLTIQKPDGSIKDIDIVREEVIIDASFARSLILDMPGYISNIGYIKLPKFYSSFENEGGNSCADDVATEILKLNEKNVNGIILDLRNNTGGSLQDVIKMSGLFIEKGPIVQVKPRSRSPYVHKDTDENVLFDGPLIVMVNNISASASEILAAALQDYGRAVIVGSTKTYGKGTVQRFYDLDRAFSDNDLKPLGALKVTVQKYFRINGGSTQLKGVESDIVLPDSWHFLDTGEDTYDNAMEWTEIDPVEFSQNVVKMNHLDEVKSLSNARVAKSDKFNLVLENAKRVKQTRDMEVYPLKLESYTELMEKRKNEAKKFDKLYDEEIDGMVISNLDVDLDYINVDASRVTRNEEWIKDVKRDFYLEETLAIIRDMIALEESFAMLKNENVIRP